MDDISALIRAIDSPIVRTYFLVTIRMAAFVAAGPIFSSEAVPKRLRFTLAIVLALSIGPRGKDLPTIAPEGTALLAAAFAEATIGTAVAVMLRVVFETATAAGALVDVFRGATTPTSEGIEGGSQNTPIASLMQAAMIALFFAVGGEEEIIRGLEATVRAFPPGGSPATFLRTIDGPSALRLIGTLFQAAFRVASPVIAFVFIVDFASALLARAAPQIQVYFVGLLVKGTLGVWVFLLTAAVGLFELVGIAIARIQDLLGG